SRTLIEAIFTDANGKEYTNRKFLVPLGKVKLPKVNIKHRIEPAKGGYNIILTSNNLAAYVQLYLTNINARFSNNFMHICAENEIVVFCETNLEISQLEEQLRIICLNNQNTEND
ncbi:MAG: glycoside hydrolase family 2 protein, partial [Tenuifilaceae bacterium]|nr:glycoside hydrolase family 2 protein [Tenuifilaceae bacterium]